MDKDGDGDIHKIRIEITEASNVMIADLASSDPYVKVYDTSTDKLIYTTAVIKKNLNPVWNEVVDVVVDPTREWPEIYRFEIWDRDLLSKDDAMGQVIVHLKVSDLGDSKTIDKWYPITGPPTKAKGELRVVVSRLWQRKQSKARSLTPHGFESPIEAVLEFADAAEQASKAGKSSLMFLASYYDQPTKAVDHLDSNFQILGLLPKRAKLETAIDKTLSYSDDDNVTVTFHFEGGSTQQFACRKVKGEWFKPAPHSHH